LHTILVPLLFTLVEHFFERVFPMCHESGFFGSPGRVRYPFVVQNGPTQLVPARTRKISFLLDNTGIIDGLSTNSGWSVLTLSGSLR
jgi:hypothetical protein